MKLGDIVRFSFPELKSDADTDTFERSATGGVALNFESHVPGVEFGLFKADRGDMEGSYLTVWSRTVRHPGDASLHPENQAAFSESVVAKARDVLMPLEPFIEEESDVSDFALIGSDAFDSLYSVDILGLHFLKVREDKTEAFEDLVREKLHPALVDRMPGMPLLYYKGIGGSRAGDYLLVFAIETIAAREDYFPTGAPETEALVEGFKPLKSLGEELITYLEEDSYLDPSTGAPAAYFESLEWTDFVRVDAPRD